MNRIATAIRNSRIATIARLLWNLPTYIEQLENLRIISDNTIDQLNDIEKAFEELVTHDDFESRLESAAFDAVKEVLENENVDVDDQIEDWVSSNMDYEAVAEACYSYLDTDEITKQVLQAVANKMREAAAEIN